jgi:hypothetical protein
MRRFKLTITAILRITKQHLRAGHIEHRIRDIRIPARHTSLHHDNLLALPSVEDRHTCNAGARFQSDGVDGVVCADDESYVRVAEVVIDFVHFKDD